MNDTTWPLPFPHGLPWLSENLGGLPLIIYSAAARRGSARTPPRPRSLPPPPPLADGPQCGNTTYAASWPLELSLYWDQGWGAGVLSAIAASSSEAFYAQLFESGRGALAMGAFTQDFLDFQVRPPLLRRPAALR